MTAASSDSPGNPRLAMKVLPENTGLSATLLGRILVIRPSSATFRLLAITIAN